MAGGNPRLLNCDGHDKPLQVSSSDFDIARHNAVITIEHDGEHRTFMIRTVQKGERIARVNPKTGRALCKPGDRVVSLLSGPDRDNPKNWYNFGWVRAGGVINVMGNCMGKDLKDDGSRKRSSYEWYALMLMNPAKWEANGYAYMMMTFCHRCNRPLTHPESIKSGLGPICAGRKAA